MRAALRPNCEGLPLVEMRCDGSPNRGDASVIWRRFVGETDELVLRAT